MLGSGRTVQRVPALQEHIRRSFSPRQLLVREGADAPLGAAKAIASLQ